MNTNFANFFDLVPFTSVQVEDSIKEFKLIFDQTRNYKVEWNIKLPMFVTSFYNYIKNKGLIPSQNEYWLFYVNENKEYLSNLNLCDEEKRGVRARVFRTYPSLIRDFHFGLFIRETNQFSSVIYNEVLDIEYGIDLIIIDENGSPIGLNLFTKTKAAKFARIVKEYRPKKKVDFKCYEIPIEFSGSKQIGDFFLYSEREIELVVKNIKDHLEMKS